MIDTCNPNIISNIVRSYDFNESTTPSINCIILTLLTNLLVLQLVDYEVSYYALESFLFYALQRTLS